MDIDKKKWGLGGRTANAPTFEKLFEGNPQRTDVPELKLNHHGKVSSKAIDNTPINSIHLRMAQRLLAEAIKHKGLDSDAVKALSLSPLTETKNLPELGKTLKASLKKVKQN